MEDRPGSSARPPTVEDWERHRSTITRLYLDENHTLPEVMSIMRERYGFNATSKMYKRRISMWELHKNIASRDMEYIWRKKREREALGKQSVFKVRDRLVKDSEIARYVRFHKSKQAAPIPDSPSQSHVVYFTPSPIQERAAEQISENETADDLFFISSPVDESSSASSIPNLFMEDSAQKHGKKRKRTGLNSNEGEFLKYLFTGRQIPRPPSSSNHYGDVERLLRSVKDYCWHSLESGLWTYDGSRNLINGLHRDRDEDISVYHFYDYFRIANALLSRGSYMEGMIKLNTAMDLVPGMLRNQSPRLLESFFNTLLLLQSGEHRDVLQIVFSYISQMAKLILGATHPLSEISSHLCNLHLRTEDTVVVTWQCVCDALDMALGTYSPATVMCRNNFIRIRYGRNGLSQRESALRKFLHDAEDARIEEGDLSFWTTKLHLVYTLASQNKLVVADEVANELLEAARNVGDFELDYKAKALESRACVQHLMGATDLACEYLRNAVDIHSHLRGSDDPTVQHLTSRLALWTASGTAGGEVIMLD